MLKNLIISIVAAALTGAIVSLYLTPVIYQASIGGNGRIFFKPQEIDSAQLAKSLAPAVVRLYASKASQNTPAEKIYLDEEILAYGAIITSDGWAVTSGLDNLAGVFVAVTSDNEILGTESFFVDPATGFIFFRILGRDLPVVTLASDLSAGQKVLAVGRGAQSTEIQSLSEVRSIKNSHIFSTETYPYLRQLSQSAPAGMPVFSLNKDLVGLTVIDSGRTLVRPVSGFTTRLSRLLGGEVKDRTYLGVNYIDLNRWPVALNKRAQTGGALIVDLKETGVAGVARNSPAEKAGLKPGQIITRINGEDLSLRVNLTEYIQSVEPGQEIELTVLQANGQETSVKVKLGKI